jgi:hypothetical protein
MTNAQKQFLQCHRLAERTHDGNRTQDANINQVPALEESYSYRESQPKRQLLQNRYCRRSSATKTVFAFTPKIFPTRRLCIVILSRFNDTCSWSIHWRSRLPHHRYDSGPSMLHLVRGDYSDNCLGAIHPKPISGQPQLSQGTILAHCLDNGGHTGPKSFQGRHL